MEKKDFYNGIWGKWTNITNGPSSRHRIRLILKIIKSNDLHGAIFDIGCGEGFLLKKLSNDNRLYGMDISEIALNNIDPGDKENIEFIIGDISEKNSLPKMRFDVIICSEVLEHVDNDEIAIKNLHELLISSGSLIVTVPYNMKYWTIHDDYAGHYRRYGWDEIINKLNRNGFESVEMFAWGWPFFSLYYKLFLKNINPNTVWGNKTKLKILVSNILYYIFFLDGLFTKFPKGRRLFILAKKI